MQGNRFGVHNESEQMSLYDSAHSKRGRIDRASKVSC